MKARPAAWVAALLLFLQASAAHAHDAWIGMDGPKHRVLYGHDGKIGTYDVDKVKRVAALDKDGGPLKSSVETSAEGVAILLSAPASLLLLDFDNGYWTKTGEGWKNKPRTDVTGATESAHSLKFAKTVLAWSPAVTRPSGQRLEIVPMSPQAPRARDRLVVQVLYEGRPLAGATVGSGEHHDEKTLTTDAEGKASLTVHKGRQMIVASHAIALHRPEAEKASLAANLLFAAR